MGVIGGRGLSQGVQVALEAEKGENMSPLNPLEGTGPCRHPDFGFLSFRTARE